MKWRKGHKCDRGMVIRGQAAIRRAVRKVHGKQVVDAPTMVTNLEDFHGSYVKVDTNKEFNQNKDIPKLRM